MGSFVSNTLNCLFLLRNSFVFPSLKTLGEDLVTVLDFLHVKYVIGLGEGAGANVLARFGLAHAARCLGLILINCTGSAASVVDSFKTKVKKKNNSTLKLTSSFCLRPTFLSIFFHISSGVQFINWKADEVERSAEDFLLYHKFGHVSITFFLFSYLSWLEFGVQK